MSGRRDLLIPAKGMCVSCGVHLQRMPLVLAIDEGRSGLGRGFSGRIEFERPGKQCASDWSNCRAVAVLYSALSVDALQRA